MLKTVMIIDEGNGWIAVDKPSGLSVHNDPGNDLVSLIRESVENDAELMGSIGYDSSFGISPVNRLDIDTSGIILLSCTKNTFRYLAKLFEKGIKGANLAQLFTNLWQTRRQIQLIAAP